MVFLSGMPVQAGYGQMGAFTKGFSQKCESHAHVDCCYTSLFIYEEWNGKLPAPLSVPACGHIPCVVTVDSCAVTTLTDICPLPDK